MTEQLKLRGTLKGHSDWVTQIATTTANMDIILSASRGNPHWLTVMEYTIIIIITDKTVIVWNLLREDTNYGIAKRALRGHNHFVSDVVISSDGQFALSGSWDGTLRLWELATGKRCLCELVPCVYPIGQTTRRFVGHTKDVLSVAFSADNRQIVSGSRDKTIKLWNTLGVCKYTIQVCWKDKVVIKSIEKLMCVILPYTEKCTLI